MFDDSAAPAVSSRIVWGNVSREGESISYLALSVCQLFPNFLQQISFEAMQTLSLQLKSRSTRSRMFGSAYFLKGVEGEDRWSDTELFIFITFPQIKQTKTISCKWKPVQTIKIVTLFILIFQCKSVHRINAMKKELISIGHTAK